jgi:mRNA interferase RelE/StbE
MEKKNKKLSIIILPDVKKKLLKLPQKEQAKIWAAIEKLYEFKGNVDFKSLTSRPEWRLRIGNWRILFRVDWAKGTLIAFDMGSRGDIYK